MAGLGGQSPGTGWAGNYVIFDAHLSAPRGIEYGAGYVPLEEHAGTIRGDHDSHSDGDNDDTWTAPIEPVIPENNVGFKMLQKMGWSQGKGLGRHEDGIREPIRAGVDAGVRLGLGKQEEDNIYTDADGVCRKKTEAELQANEAPERTKRREEQVERDHRIKEDVTQILRTFYCEVCDKQYTTAMELEAHLSSYDHHHRKRLNEMRAATNERTRSERMKREQKQMGREAARLNEQFQRAQQGGVGQAAAVPHLLPQEAQPGPGSGGLPPPLPSLDMNTATSSGQAPSFGITFGLGGGGRGGLAGRGMLGKGGLAGRGPVGTKRPGIAGGLTRKAGAQPVVGALAGFGADSDSDTDAR